MVKIIGPQPGAQTEFAKCEADICFYGGQAGGGKSFALLMEPLHYAHIPGFIATIFRKELTQIKQAGGLWDEANRLYIQIPPAVRPVFNISELKVNFPSGALIKFAHCDTDAEVYRYQGGQICLLAFDEVTHFSWFQFCYLMSRNRSTCGVKSYVRATCNPDRDSWVRNMLDWWIDPNTGLAIPERSGIIRYMCIVDETVHWDDDPANLMHHFSAKEIEAGAHPRSFTFIPASIYDNKKLLDYDPNYISAIKGQNRVEQERLLGGNWNISYNDFGTVLNRDDFNRFNLEEKLKIPGYFTESYFVIDGASTVKTSGDYSVIGLFAKGRFDQAYYIIDWVRIRLQEPDLEQLIVDKWTYWRNTVLKPRAINIEDKSCGIGMLQRLPRKGIPCCKLKAEKDKFLRLNDNLGIIKSGFVFIPDDAPWVIKFFEECEHFRADLKHIIMDGEKTPHDDQVDVLAYGLSSQINKVAVGIYVAPKPSKPRHGLGLGFCD